MELDPIDEVSLAVLTDNLAGLDPEGWFQAITKNDGASPHILRRVNVGGVDINLHTAFFGGGQDGDRILVLGCTYLGYDSTVKVKYLAYNYSFTEDTWGLMPWITRPDHKLCSLIEAVARDMSAASLFLEKAAGLKRSS